MGPNVRNPRPQSSKCQVRSESVERYSCYKILTVFFVSCCSFVQFYLDFSDSIPSSSDAIFVVLEYSINGGIEWTTFEVIPLNPATSQLYQVPLPNRALSLATKLKWSQLGGYGGNLNTVWAIDEVNYMVDTFYSRAVTPKSIISDLHWGRILCQKFCGN